MSTLKTLENSLRLLKCFTKENPAWGVRELSRELNISHSIVYRILSTFEQQGFLSQNPETNKYELGLKFWEYSLLIQDKLNLSKMISPVIKRLSEETEESIFFTWLDGLEGICLGFEESPQKIKFAISLGSRSPLYAGASAKIIMAYLPRERQNEIIEKGLKPFAKNTITDPEQLLDNLNIIRNQGWCYSVGEFSDDVAGLAVPLFNRKKEIVGSLTIAAPQYRLTEDKVNYFLQILKRDSEEIQDYIYRFNLQYLESI